MPLDLAACRALVARAIARGQAHRAAIPHVDPKDQAWRQRRRAVNISKGLRGDGKPRQRSKIDRNGLSKDHAAYMRAWRARRRAP